MKFEAHYHSSIVVNYLLCLKQRNSNRPGESYVDQSQGLNNGAGPALLFATKLEEKNIAVSSTVPGEAQNPVESDMSSATTVSAMDRHPGTTDNRAMPFPISLQPNFFNSGRTTSATAQNPPRMASDAQNMATQLQLSHARSCITDGAVAVDKLKEQELAIEGGTISISSVYSQG